MIQHSKLRIQNCRPLQQLPRPPHLLLRRADVADGEAEGEAAAQAVLVMAYELWLADERSRQEFKPPRRDSIPAPVALLEKMFEDLERALWTIDFFKTRQTEGVMRTLRGILHRAELDTREASFLRAVAIEVRKFFERMKG